jgi:hypothetical protein
MKNKVIWALTATNVLLLLGLTTRLTAPAQAQAARPSEYLLIPGEIVGGNSAIVWIIDSRNRELSAVTSNANGKGIDMMTSIDLKRLLP